MIYKEKALISVPEWQRKLVSSIIEAKPCGIQHQSVSSDSDKADKKIKRIANRAELHLLFKRVYYFMM